MSDSLSDTNRDDDATQADPLIDKVIDARYRVISLLGSGGVGLVYRAQHLKTERFVALKVLRHGYSDVALLRKRFEREAQLMSSLSHPHIVPMTDYGIYNDMPYLVMELLEGTTLDEELERGLLGAERLLGITRSILRAMSYAHEQGVIHRDLKPGNIFLQDLLANESGDPGHVRLLDFGMAKMLPQEGEGQSEQDVKLTRSGAIIGTPRYMAPEQASGERVDARCDVYSAGILLFEMLAGQPPFSAENRTALLRAHLVEAVPDPRQLRDGLEIDETFRQFLLRALAKDPGGRFVDGTEMLRAFDALSPTAVTCEAVANTPQAPPANERLTPLDSKISTQPRVQTPSVPAVVWLVIAAFTLGLLGLWWLVRTKEEPQVQPPVSTSVVPPTETRAASLPEDKDYFDRLPDSIQAIADRVSKSKSLDRIAHRDMRREQRRNPNDPRPSLILAHDFATRGSRANAITRYRQALSIDKDSRRYPSMLPDLIAVASSSDKDEDEESATALILETFDIDQVERAVAASLANSEQRSVRVRLNRLQRRSAER